MKYPRRSSPQRFYFGWSDKIGILVWYILVVEKVKQGLDLQDAHHKSSWTLANPKILIGADATNVPKVVRLRVQRVHDEFELDQLSPRSCLLILGETQKAFLGG